MTTDTKAWDAVRRMGWGPQFAAGSVLSILRFGKDKEAARIPWEWLKEGVAGKQQPFVWRTIWQQLIAVLTPEELALLEHKEPM